MPEILIKGGCTWTRGKDASVVRLEDDALHNPLAGRRVRLKAHTKEGGDVYLVTDDGGRITVPAGTWLVSFPGDDLYEGCTTEVKVPRKHGLPLSPVVGGISFLLGLLALWVVWRRFRGRREATTQGHDTATSTIMRSLFRKGREVIVTDSEGQPLPSQEVLVISPAGEPWKGSTDSHGRVVVPAFVLPGTIFVFSARGFAMSMDLDTDMGPLTVKMPPDDRLVLETFFTLLDLLGMDDPRLFTPRQAMDSGAIAREMASFIDRCAFGPECGGDAGHLVNYLKSLIKQKIEKKLH